MSAPVPSQQPSPLLFFNAAFAYRSSAAIKAAVELDLFTAIGEHGDAGATSAQIAAHTSAAERGVRILCDFLAVDGFLSKKNARYLLTQDSAVFLDRRSPAYMGSILGFLHSPHVRAHYESLSDAVRKGGTATSADGVLEPHHPAWVDFARAMAPMMALPAIRIAEILGAANGGPWKVLDIAAGHGTFGITLARQNPQAEIFAVDWPNVLALAQENARAAGVDGRYRPLPGSAFDVDFGTGFDCVLLTNFLHHFDATSCETLLGKIHAALKPDGQVVTLEFVPNDDRITPREAAMFSLTMLASTPAGDAYTFAEYDRMFRAAGFASSEIHPLPPTPQSLIVSHIS